MVLGFGSYVTILGFGAHEEKARERAVATHTGTHARMHARGQ
jgi:hypothetical protein